MNGYEGGKQMKQILDLITKELEEAFEAAGYDVTNLGVMEYQADGIYIKAYVPMEVYGRL